MPLNPKIRLLAWCAVGALLPVASQAADSASAPVQAAWKVQEIRYNYVGYTTAYNCDAAEDKIKAILLAVGAHPQTRVRTAGCEFNRPTRNFFVTITAISPAPASEVVKTVNEKSREELLAKLGTKNPVSDDQFPALWKTVDLAHDRRLNLQPGDCELMDGLRQQVFPKMAIKPVSDRVQCTPRQLSISTPELTVSALTAAPTPDQRPNQKPAD